MSNQKVTETLLIGISVDLKISNDNAGSEIGKHWQRFETEGVHAKIPNKTTEDVRAVYHSYEGDHTKPSADVKTLPSSATTKKIPPP